MKIVFVTGPTSIHVVRWVRQLRDTDWDVHLVDPGSSRPHSDLNGIVLHSRWPAPGSNSHLRVKSEWPFQRGRFFLEKRAPWLGNALLKTHERRVAETLEMLSPDVVHSIATQYAGYVMTRAIRHLGGWKPSRWIHSVWGSDLVRFSTDDDHRGEIVEVLNSCGFLYCDCKRDVALATDLGFRGEVLGVVPGGGGYDLAAMAGLRSPDKATLRKTIAVKGYEHAAGRALAAVKALESVAESLAGYRVVFHSTHPIVNEEVERLKATAPFEVDVLPRGPIEDVWRLFGRARLALGLSRFDGVPNTMLEAMIMGALPIQTDPGGASREWIQDGVNGLLVPWDDVGAVADALRRGVTDDGLVDGADEMNTVIAQNRLSSTTIKRTVIENYARVVSGGP